MCRHMLYMYYLLSFLVLQENQPPLFRCRAPLPLLAKWSKAWLVISQTDSKFTPYFFMPLIKRNKYSKSTKVNGNYAAVPMTSELSTWQISSDLIQLTKGKEKVLWQKMGLFEEIFVDAIARKKGIRPDKNWTFHNQPPGSQLLVLLGL